MKSRYLSLVFIAASVALASPSTANEKYRDAARQLEREAAVALDAARIEEALTLYERALVANPANVQVLIGLGRTHEALGRVGRGLKYYRQALAVDPNALPALEAQAVAFLKRDLVERSEANREKLARLCPTGCDQLESVETALEAYKAEKAAASNMAEAGTGRE